MAADGRVVIDIVLDDGKVVKGVANIDKKLGGVAGAGKKAALGIGALVTALGLVSIAGKAIDMVTRSIDGAISRYDTLNNFPKVLQQIGFSAGDSEKAINKLSDGIQGLPTTLDDVAGTAQRIAVMTGDLEGATDTTLALNNAFIASGSSGEDASRGLEQYVQMLSKGEVDLESWRSLQETMGVALNDVAKAFKFTGASAQNDLYDALKEGDITFDQFNKKIIELSNQTDGFADRARTASGGIRTAWTNMGTAIVRGVTNIIESIDNILANTPLQSIENIITNLGNAFFSVLDGVANAIPLLIGRLSSTIEFAKQIFLGLVNTIQTAFNFIYTVISNVLSSQIIPFIQTQLALLQQFWQENGAQIVQAVQNAFQLIVSIIQALMPVAQFIIQYVWSAIQNIISGALSVIQGLIQVFTGIFTGDWSLLWEGIKNILSGAVSLILGIMSLSFLGGIRKVFMNLLKNGVNIVKSMWTSIVNFFRNFGSNTVNFASNMVSRVIAFFRNLLSQGINIFNSLRTFGASIWNSLVQAVLGNVRNMLNGVRQTFRNMLSVVRNLMHNVKSTIINLWNQAYDFLKGINLKNVGKDIIRGLIKGIGSMADAVADKISGIASSIKNGITGALQIHSPSRWMRDMVGKNIVLGVIEGVDRTQQKLDNSMEAMAGNAMRAASPRIESNEKTRRNAKKIMELHYKFVGV